MAGGTTPPPDHNNPSAEGDDPTGWSTVEPGPIAVPSINILRGVASSHGEGSDQGSQEGESQPNKRRRLNPSPGAPSSSHTLPLPQLANPPGISDLYPSTSSPSESSSTATPSLLPTHLATRTTVLQIDDHASEFASLLAKTTEDGRRQRVALAEAEAEGARRVTNNFDPIIGQVMDGSAVRGGNAGRLGEDESTPGPAQLEPDLVVTMKQPALWEPASDPTQDFLTPAGNDAASPPALAFTRHIVTASEPIVSTKEPSEADAIVDDAEDAAVDNVEPDSIPAPFNIDDLDHAQLELFVAQFAESQRQAAEAEERDKFQEEEREAAQVEAMDVDGDGDADADADTGGEPIALDSAIVPAGPTTGNYVVVDTGNEVDDADQMEIDPALSLGVIPTGSQTQRSKPKDGEKRVAFVEPEDSKRKTSRPEVIEDTSIRSEDVTPTSPPARLADLQSAASALSALDLNAQASILSALQQLTGMMGTHPARENKADMSAPIDLTDGEGPGLRDGSPGIPQEGTVQGDVTVETRPSIGGSSSIVHGANRSASSIADAAQRASAANAEAASKARPDIVFDDADILPEEPESMTLDSREASTLMPALQAQPSISTMSAMRPMSGTIPSSGGPLSPANRGNTPLRPESSSPPPAAKAKRGKYPAAYTYHDSDDEELLAAATAGDETDGEGIIGETAKERRERRRSRIVLSCSECHRRKQQCDRNIPCGRCVKRGVSYLCRMDSGPSRGNKRKREDEALEPELSPSATLLARISALESLLRAQSQQAQMGQTGFPVMLYPPPYPAIGSAPPSANSAGPQSQPLAQATQREESDQRAAAVEGPPAMTDTNDDDGAGNISAGFAALLAATAAAEREAEGQGAEDVTTETIDQSGEAADLLAQIKQSLQKVQPTSQAESIHADAPMEIPADEATQNELLVTLLGQLAGDDKSQPASLLNSLLASIPHQPKIPGVWADISSALPETGVQLQLAYNADPDPRKLNLGLVGFREDDGRIFVPPTTRQMERALFVRGGLSHEALPVEGYAPFLQLGLRYSYGVDSLCFKQGRIAAVQTVSLTGALRLGATFLSRHPSHPPLKSIYIPTPTVEEDAWALKDAGLEIRLYRFYDKKTGLVDWDGMQEDLTAAPDSSILLLHVGGSSPTGAEMTAHQWRSFTDLVKHKRHIVFAVLEFQGLRSGDPARDAQPLRFLAHEDVPVVTAQSFDCSMGLYSDSPTILSVVANSLDARYRIESQLRSISRAMHAHPTPWGANIAAGILGNPDVCRNWLSEIKAMSERLRSIREKLFDQLTHKLNTPGNWTHIRRSAGMFCSVLLTSRQLEILAHREHIHLLPDGCFSLGCLNAVKIERFCQAIDNVVRHPDGMPGGMPVQAPSIQLAMDGNAQPTEGLETTSESGPALQLGGEQLQGSALNVAPSGAISDSPSANLHDVGLPGNHLLQMESRLREEARLDRRSAAEVDATEHQPEAQTGHSQGQEVSAECRVSSVNANHSAADASSSEDVLKEDVPTDADPEAAVAAPPAAQQVTEKAPDASAGSLSGENQPGSTERDATDISTPTLMAAAVSSSLAVVDAGLTEGSTVAQHNAVAQPSEMASPLADIAILGNDQTSQPGQISILVETASPAPQAAPIPLPPMTIIVAATLDNGIGKAGGLPWKLPKEMKYFARVTIGEQPSTASSTSPAPSETVHTPATPLNTVIMGRKTWDGIPPKYRPLANRKNVIITRDVGSVDVNGDANTSVHASVADALLAVSNSSPTDGNDFTARSGRFFLIGGSQLYTQSLEAIPTNHAISSISPPEPAPPAVDRILLTRILTPFSECDAFVPSLPSVESSKGWRLAGHEELREWVGWAVPEGVVQEGEVEYRFEMWTR